MKKSKKIRLQQKNYFYAPTPLMGLSYGEQSLCRASPSPVHWHEGAPMELKSV